jgi:hypothetical protein
VWTSELVWTQRLEEKSFAGIVLLLSAAKGERIIIIVIKDETGLKKVSQMPTSL